MLFYLLLAIFGGGLLVAAAPPPSGPGAINKPFPSPVSPVTSSRFPVIPGFLKLLGSLHEPAHASGPAPVNKRTADAANPKGSSGPTSGQFTPKCPDDNHALASVSSKDMKIDFRFQLECNKDRALSDMPGMPLDKSDWYSCAQACADNYNQGKGCKAFTWRHDQVKCYLKSSVPAQSDFTEAWSSVLTIFDDGSKSKTLNNTEIITSGRHPSHMDVALHQRASSMPETQLDHIGPRDAASTVLISAYGQNLDTFKASPCANFNHQLITVSESHDDQIYFTHLECDWERRGSDLANMPLDWDQVHTWQDCLKQCFASAVSKNDGPKCKAISFLTEGQYRGCWMKDSVPSGNVLSNTVSFVLTDPNRPFHGDSPVVASHAPVPTGVTSSSTIAKVVTHPTTVAPDTQTIPPAASNTVSDGEEHTWIYDIHGEGMGPSSTITATEPHESVHHIKEARTRAFSNRAQADQVHNSTCPGNDGRAWWMPLSTPNKAVRHVAILECSFNRPYGDAPGMPLKNVDNWEACALECQKKHEHGCVAFTWNTKKNCFLKYNVIPFGSKQDDVWSGILETQPLRGFRD